MRGLGLNKNKNHIFLGLSSVKVCVFDAALTVLVLSLRMLMLKREMIAYRIPTHPINIFALIM